MPSSTSPTSGSTAFPVPELYNIDFAQVEAAAKALAENADIVLGIKVRMSENVIAKHGLEPLKRAIRACETAGAGGKVMCHIGGVETPELMSQILDTLRAGDVLTHCYSGAPNIGGAFTNIVQDGKLLPAALAAKQRGVMFDVGHGGGSFDYTVAEVGDARRRGPGHHLLRHPRVLRQHARHAVSHLGDEQVPRSGPVAGAGGRDGDCEPGQGHQSRIPSSARCRSARRRTCRCSRWWKGRSSSSTRATTSGRARLHLKPAGVVMAGVPFGRPYQAPFAVR